MITRIERRNGIDRFRVSSGPMQGKVVSVRYREEAWYQLQAMFLPERDQDAYRREVVASTGLAHCAQQPVTDDVLAALRLYYQPFMTQTPGLYASRIVTGRYAVSREKGKFGRWEILDDAQDARIHEH